MRVAVLFALLLVPAIGSVVSADEKAKSLLDARKGFTTKLLRTERDAEPLEEPPDALFSLVTYKSPIGELSAYLSKPSAAGKKHPAIIWITGGFPPGGIGSSAWERLSSENDQSAKAYRQAGLVMLYPTVRGSFGNPGKQETFYGEVDDVLAALAFLETIDYVDPSRIYLGGHSTGGTLALLVAAATDRFRAVFAFGPVDDPSVYGEEALTYDPGSGRENMLRSPIHFLGAITSRTFVIEGATGGNLESLEAMRSASKNDAVSLLPIEGSDHFDVLAPSNELIAARIAKLDAKTDLTLTASELTKACDAAATARREAADLRTLAAIRSTGADLNANRTVRHYLLAAEKAPLTDAAKEAAGAGFKAGEIKEYEDEDGDPYYVLIVSRTIALRDLDAIFAASATVSRIAKKHDLQYDGWNAK